MRYVIIIRNMLNSLSDKEKKKLLDEKFNKRLLPKEEKQGLWKKVKKIIKG